MIRVVEKIPVENALNDLLREYGLTLNDLLDAMITEDIDVYNELLDRLESKSRDVVETINNLPWRLAALTLFVLQAFYIVNPSGLYKGFFIDPPREYVMNGFKARFSGLLVLINRLKNVV